jgi:hypothetical protein
MEVILTREVDALHERTETGIRFNVETVKGLGKSLKISEKEIITDVAKRFYEENTLKISVETGSFLRDRAVRTGGSFVDTALLAFADHYPLTIAPDDIWSLLSFALAKHVDKNAEKLRSKFVSHAGKKVLEVRVDHFVLGGMLPEDWERDVFPDFSNQIRGHIGDEIHNTIASGFSTTTPSTKAAHEITLMAAMKHYFSYKVCAIFTSIVSVV